MPRRTKRKYSGRKYSYAKKRRTKRRTRRRSNRSSRASVATGRSAYNRSANKFSPGAYKMRTSTFNRLLKMTGAFVSRDASGSGFPPRMGAKQLYSEQASLPDSSQGTTYATGVWNLSSTFDPNWASASWWDGQPRGRDTMATIYAKYIVPSASWKIQLRNRAATNGIRGWIIAHSETTDPISNYEEALRNPYAITFTAAGSGEDVDGELISLAGRVSLKQFLKAGETVGEHYVANVGAIPSSGIFLHFHAEEGDGTTLAADSVMVNVQIQYNAQYFNVTGNQES